MISWNCRWWQMFIWAQGTSGAGDRVLEQVSCDNISKSFPSLSFCEWTVTSTRQCFLGGTFDVALCCVWLLLCSSRPVWSILMGRFPGFQAQGLSQHIPPENLGDASLWSWACALSVADSDMPGGGGMGLEVSSLLSLSRCLTDMTVHGSRLPVVSSRILNLGFFMWGLNCMKPVHFLQSHLLPYFTLSW